MGQFNMNLADNSIKASAGKEQSQAVVTEPQLRKLAHLPLLTLFYLLFQRQFSSTPVTALELAAYLGLELKVVEGILYYLKKKEIVRPFKEDLAAYCLKKELDQISVKDMIEMVGEIQELLQRQGLEFSSSENPDSNEKYRKIYSDIASEMLQLFGTESMNKMPV